MGRVQAMWDQVRSRLAAAGGEAVRTTSRLSRSALSQVQRTIDLDRWRTAQSWRDRSEAVSWPRASAGLGLFAAVAIGVWFVGRPDGPYAPRLPTPERLEAIRAARVGVGDDLSPALAAANRSAPPETQ